MRRISTIAVILIFDIAIVRLFSAFVPFHLDEFTQYHALACFQYPLNTLASFRDDCQEYNLDFLNSGVILPLRSFPYVGSLPSVYYYPLFLLWRSPLSARFLGFLFFALQSAVAARLLNMKFFPVFGIFLLFFPYVFQHLADTGPVAFQGLCILLSLLLLEQWIQRKRWREPLILAFISFLAFYTKINYLWVLPGFVLYFLCLLQEHKGALHKKRKIPRILLQGVVSAGLAFFLASLLFLSTNPENAEEHPYWEQITNDSQYSIREIFHGDIFRSPVIRSAMNPLEATQRVFQARNLSIFTYGYSALLYLSFPLLFAASMFMGVKLRGFWLRGFAAYLAFAVTAVCILLTREAWAMHHVVTAYPFLIMAIGYASRALFSEPRKKTADVLRKAWIIIAGIFLAFNLSLFFIFPFQHLNPYEDSSKAEVNMILADPYLAKKYVYVVVSWGAYFLQSLYGNDEQAVLYIDEFDPETIRSIKSIAYRLDRQILMIYHRQVPGTFDNMVYSNFPDDQSMPDLGILRPSFRLFPCVLQTNAGSWRIALEHDGYPQNPCFQPR